jgi:hypothetical protein
VGGAWATTASISPTVTVRCSSSRVNRICGLAKRSKSVFASAMTPPKRRSNSAAAVVDRLLDLAFHRRNCRFDGGNDRGDRLAHLLDHAVEAFHERGRAQRRGQPGPHPQPGDQADDQKEFDGKGDALVALQQGVDRVAAQLQNL